MIYNIENELRNFTYITSVYKYISNYHLKRHQIGRKIGDMLEIITMHEVHRSPQLRTRLITEGKLEGFTHAGHKVEFGFRDCENGISKLFGAIECKCVGVEVTTDGKGSACKRKIEQSASFSLRFGGNWMSEPIIVNITVMEIREKSALISVNDNLGSLECVFDLPVASNFKIVIDENQIPLVSAPEGNMLNDIPGIIRLCKIISLDSITADNCIFTINNCLTGPQTIEKAKQASFVAMDLRKKIDGYWGKEEVNEVDKTMNFIHVICEFSHWEEKSRSVINTCIDHNVIVPDAVIIKAFDVFETRFGLSNMLNMISKNQFLSNKSVREAIEEVMNYFEGHVFYDIDLKNYVSFDYLDGKLRVITLD